MMMVGCIQETLGCGYPEAASRLLTGWLFTLVLCGKMNKNNYDVLLVSINGNLLLISYIGCPCPCSNTNYSD